MNIQMVDLVNQYKRIESEIDQAIKNVLNKGNFIQGNDVFEFAESLKAFVDAENVVTCANGTDALQIAFMALDLKQGDEVIVPVHTYVATAEVLALLGLKIVFCDVEPDFFTLDAKAIENKITSKTKAIVPVHLYGQCANMESILHIASKYNLHVIEDTAQALGAIYKFSDGSQKFAGVLGDIGTTSFFPSKNLGAYGDGGAMFVKDETIALRCKMIANHGQQKKYYHDLIGCNSRLDTIQAAILNVKLKYLDDFNKSRNQVAALYDNFLSQSDYLIVPKRADYSTHVFHQYTIQILPPFDRDKVKSELEQRQIPSMIYYPVPLHLQQAYYDEQFPMGSFPVSENLSKTVLSLPIHTEMSEEQVFFIADSLLNILKN